MIFTRIPSSVNPANLTTSAIQAFKMPVAGILPWDERIAAQRYDSLPLLDAPDSPWSQAVHALAEQIQHDALH
jgi:hypothetical protein